MLRVAICDDDCEVCKLIYDMLTSFTDIQTLCIDIFETGERLCNAVSMDKQYDLYILDIELKTTTGVQIGAFIRSQLGQSHAEILFISGKSRYAMQLFDLRPLNFLIKPINASEIHKCMRSACSLLAKDSPYFEYSRWQSLNRIPYRDITYFESANKSLLIHTLTNILKITMQLQDVMTADPLPPKHFIQIHQSYVVNFRYVKRVTYSEITMANGDVIPISYSYRKQMRMRVCELSIALREDDYG